MKTEKKNNKESTIGKIIYGTLLFMPLFAIGITCLVNVWKDNKPTKINYKYETNEVNSIQDLIIGNIYHFEVNTTNIPSNTNCLINFTEFYNLEYGNYVSNGTWDILGSNQPSIYFTNNGTNSAIEFCIASNGHWISYSSIKIDLVYNGSDRVSSTLDLSNYLSKCNNVPIENVEESENNNIFYTAINQVEESNLFNWTSNSVIYTGIKETCETLSITNTFIPLLLTYWLIISVLYFLYDIVLMMLSILHKKIHELQDSF